HIRYEKLLKQLFGEQYQISYCFSLKDFFYRLFAYHSQSPIINGLRQKLWFQQNLQKIQTKKKSVIQIDDMTEAFLKSDSHVEDFHYEPQKKEKVFAVNYYWFPYVEINPPAAADLILLPELYNGNFSFVTLLIHQKSGNLAELFETSQSIPALYLASALKMYYFIKKIPLLNMDWKWQDFQIKNRIFSFKDIGSDDNVNKVCQKYWEKGIILNSKPPFYQYLPQTLAENELRFLRRLKI
ncbi:MAG: hypothetical protein MJB14_05065, partial [Spirochaetes bacterium]|nr:hypothetical protein [Spirochaetota bacterium]